MSNSASFAKEAQRTHKLAVAGMLSAVAFVLMYVEFPIPALIPSFIKLDVSDLPELLAAFALGPVWGVVVTLLKNEILRRGILPYYGTSMSHLASQRLALAAGFVPAWAELTTSVI